MTNETNSIRYGLEKGRLVRTSVKYKPSDGFKGFRESPATYEEVITPTSKTEAYLLKVIREEGCPSDYSNYSDRLQRALRVCSNIATTKANQNNFLYNIGNADHVADCACWSKYGPHCSGEWDLSHDLLKGMRELIKRLKEFTHYGPDEKKYILDQKSLRDIEKIKDSELETITGRIFDRDISEQEYQDYLNGRYGSVKDFLDREQDIQAVRKVEESRCQNKPLTMRERLAYGFFRFLVKGGK